MRIISGERRGAKLLTPKGTYTRPTRGRVKEALFNFYPAISLLTLSREELL